MGVFTRIGNELAKAFRVNLDFLTSGFDELPVERSLLSSELRGLVAREMVILVHKRNKWVEGDETARERWFNDLEAFVSRTLRPHLAGQSVIALWNDSALMRTLDAMVANEQAELAAIPVRVPVTGRFDSHWAN